MSAKVIACFIYRQAARQWVDEGWKIRVDLREDSNDRVAELDDEKQEIILKPHGKKDLPIERSLWHEWLHMVFENEDKEAEVLTLENATWPILPAILKKHLRKLVEDVTGGSPQ